MHQIEREFAIANHAQRIGNDGMVRVCARRAAGVAITFWLQSNARSSWGVDAMNQLRSLALEDSIPQDVREAAKRLSTKVTEQFTSPFSTTPLTDSKTIIHHFMEQI